MNLRIFTSILAASAMTLLASLTGCVIVDKNDPETGTAGMSSTSSDDATTTPTSGSGTSGTSDETGVLTGGATITTEVPTSTDASATGDSTTAESTTGDSTGGDSTTGEVNAELQASCEAACKVFLECQPDTYPDIETCAAECIDGAPGGPTCEAAATAFNSCIGGFTCDELDKALTTMDFGACTAVFNDYVASCNP